MWLWPENADLLWKVISGVIGAAVATVSFFVYRLFATTVNIGVSGDWAGPSQSLLVVRITLENISKVRITPRELLLQAVPYPDRITTAISQFVPFDKWKVIGYENPLVCPCPVPYELRNLPRHLYPGEKQVLEILLPAQSNSYHLGAQIVVEKLPFGGEKRTWRNTATCWAIRPAPPNSA